MRRGRSIAVPLMTWLRGHDRTHHHHMTHCASGLFHQVCDDAMYRVRLWLVMVSCQWLLHKLSPALAGYCA
jgi:hypothetical protein